MKRKRGRTLFFWGGDNDTKTLPKKIKSSQESSGAETEIEFDSPQLGLLLTRAPDYRNCMPVPYEILMKILKNVLETSDNTLKDLCNLARVCETWRQIIINTPSLWSRVDLSKLPMTSRNINTIERIFKNLPSIDEHVREVSLSATLCCKNTKSSSFLENLVSSPNLSKLMISDLNSKNSWPTLLIRSISRTKKIRELSIIRSRCIFNNQKWLSDHLFENGKQLETLNLAMSLTSVSNQLFKSIGSGYCPNLKVLDISTCDAVTTHSFDATVLAKAMPNLEVLRVANISFKRVYEPPDVFGLNNLRELSMPIGLRDADRDDALFATLTFGSNNIKSLDLRGSTISGDALLELPSYQVTELHIDDLSPLQRSKYHKVIGKWSSSLELLSLVKINCSETIKKCLEALAGERKISKIRELDLSSSAVTSQDLTIFLKSAKSLDSINLSSCRSLPRGCKGLYSKVPKDRSTQKLALLKSRLA